MSQLPQIDGKQTLNVAYFLAGMNEIQSLVVRFKLSPRARSDDALKREIARIYAEDFGVYGARKVWRQLQREGFDIARCTMERLMRDLGLEGVIRGKRVCTTVSDKAQPCPLDRFNRRFQAPRPNALWVADFTFVATWSGFVYVAFVIDFFARRIVGWRVSRKQVAFSLSTTLNMGGFWKCPTFDGSTAYIQRTSINGIKLTRITPINRFNALGSAEI